MMDGWWEEPGNEASTIYMLHIHTPHALSLVVDTMADLGLQDALATAEALVFLEQTSDLSMEARLVSHGGLREREGRVGGREGGEKTGSRENI